MCVDRFSPVDYSCCSCVLLTGTVSEGGNGVLWGAKESRSGKIVSNGNLCHRRPIIPSSIIQNLPWSMTHSAKRIEYGYRMTLSGTGGHYYI
jgi:hypothetical protein